MLDRCVVVQNRQAEKRSGFNFDFTGIFGFCSTEVRTPRETEHDFTHAEKLAQCEWLLVCLPGLPER